MRVVSIIIPLVLAPAIFSKDRPTSEATSTRLPLNRSFRYRPPLFAAPHSAQVFDARLAKEELLGVKSKYRDAERILKGIGLAPAIEIPDLYGQEHHERQTKTEIDSAGNNTVHAFWDDDLQPHDDTWIPLATQTPRGKRRCTDGDDDMDRTTYDLSPDFEHQLEARAAPNNVPPPGVPLSDSSKQNKRADAHMNMIDFVVGGLDVLYYGELEFGYPSQSITLDVDTGSADLWVPSKCQSCKTKQFDSGTSISFKDSGEAFKITYGSGWAEGTIAQDRVTLGNLTIEKQYFGAATDVSEDFRGSPASGVLGMAFGSISTAKKTTFFEGLITSTQVKAPLFGVHLTRGKERGSELCIGCVNHSKFTGEMYWIPVVSRTYWSVEMTGHSVSGNLEVYETPLTAAIDTGSTLIYLPFHEADALYQAIPDSRQATEFNEPIWTFPCTSRFELSLRFGTRLFLIHPWDFNLGRMSPSSDECVGGILGLPEGFPTEFAIIGDEFLKSWYSVYDYSEHGRIGFGYSTNNK